jgi:8-oxo-dGTP pyrophosphatase MutT (NUDIX family)
MEHCYDCGVPLSAVDGFPVCPTHGPRWKLRRNAPCAEVAIERDGFLLMQRRAIEPFVGCWELPGGYMDLGETPAEAARREVREELGAEVRLTGFLGIFVDEWQPGEYVQVHAFVGEIDAEPVIDENEVLDYAWLAANELPSGQALSHGYEQRVDAWRSGRRGPLLPGIGA